MLAWIAATSPRLQIFDAHLLGAIRIVPHAGAGLGTVAAVSSVAARGLETPRDS